MNKQLIYDSIIIGTGPAGLTASIYASRYRLKNLILGKEKGGTIGLAHNVENYPGFRQIAGLDLMDKIERHARDLGGKIIYDPVQRVKKNQNNNFLIFTSNKKEYETKTVIIATGTKRRKLNISGEEEYLGKGVSYCTTCDAPFFRNKKVALVGGSDGAVSGAVHLSEFANKVYLIYRGDKLRAEPAWVQEWNKVRKKDRGVTIFNTNVTKIHGDGKKVKKLKLDKEYNGAKELEVDGVFIEIGGVPGTGLAQELELNIDDDQYIKVDSGMRTSKKGVFAAGDCTNFLPEVQQMITAAAMGALAARSSYEYLKKEKAPQQKGI